MYVGLIFYIEMYFLKFTLFMILSDFDFEWEANFMKHETELMLQLVRLVHV